MVQMIMLCGSYIKMKARQFFSEEKGAVDIVAIVILIAIAVALAVLFREQIGNLVTNLFGGISEQSDVFSDEFVMPENGDGNS